MLKTIDFDWKEFLARPVSAACTDHVVQFYETEVFLAKALSHYIKTGLDLGEAVVIIATPEHEAAFRSELERVCPYFEEYFQEGQLQFLNAQTTLSFFMREGLPDRTLFRATVGKQIERTQKKFSRIRAYGEMVNVLRAQGNTPGMIALETEWNDLSQLYSFSLLCGYQMDSFSEDQHSEAFTQVCNSHSHVLPSESYLGLTGAEQLRAIAHFQRQANTLKLELCKRELIEVELQKAIQSRDEFLSIASHELKTPITSLLLQTQLQQKRLEKKDPSVFDPQAISKNLTTTCRSVKRLSQLVDDMLDISRITYGKFHFEMEAVNLGALVRDVVDRFDDQLRMANCKYRLTLDSGVTGDWDPYRLEQVIVNLLTNAIKYSPGRAIEISVTSDQTLAHLSVRDQGVGILPENLERIFQRFERAISADTVSGLGLGLYISRQIVTAHQGRIWAESTLGQGTTFHITLPMN